MRKMTLMLLLAVCMGACASDEEDAQPVFVSQVEMPSLADAFAPGDEVTVRAQGFEAGDEIMFDIRWPLANEILDEGYARGVWAIITRQTASSITFLAPGHYPASTVEVLLRRAGRMQSLGMISVKDGQAPDKALLYGIVGPDAENDAPRGIDRIDPATGETTRIADFAPGEELERVVNAPGTNRIYGLLRRTSGSLGAFYDLTMRYMGDSDPEQYLLVGSINGDAAYLRAEGRRLYLNSLSTTRTLPVEIPLWELPDGIEPQMLTRYPFVLGQNGILLLSADNGDGTWSPVGLHSRIGGYRVAVGDPVACEALIPFYTYGSEQTNSLERYLAAGFVVSAPGGGPSELRLFDSSTMSLDEPFATVPNPVLSVAVDSDTAAREIYCLLETRRGGALIQTFDQETMTWRNIPGIDYPYSEIVLAR